MTNIENDNPSSLNEPAASLPPLVEQAPVGRKFDILRILLPLATLVVGLGAGYLIWGNQPARAKASMVTLQEQVNPKNGYQIPVAYGKYGPQLVDAGVIDYDRFAQVYAEAGNPLSQEEKDILTQGSTKNVVINQHNAHFLLNYFWAVGLANKNRILDSGPLKENSKGKIEGFASTGGWTIGKKAVTDLYSSVPLFNLSAEQQGRLEEAAGAIYRPCCDNPTIFPDCNHGMAMLGLLEMMAAQDASVDEMLKAAKYVNAFWFPQQTLEQAVFFKTTEGKNFKDVDARTIVGAQYSSGSGFGQVHQWLAGKGLLNEAPQDGGGCGV